MHSKNTNESNVSSLSTGNNGNSTTRNKTSPNTRAKSNCVVKSHSDPYAFSKIDDEDKIPLKRIKVAEKIGKEIGVNTSSLSTMTEPEYLGPCEPGTSIELQGIVWLETATGLLVINVTWRGRTYVGTLMDSTKYEFTPSFSQENLGKFEGRPPNRSSRGKKRQVGNPGNHFSLRSNNIRHSRRLSESMNSSNADGMIKKLSTRQSNNLINYFDSTNQSATASASGDSDTDKNSYSKFSTSSKTRSVTRSITKLNKAALCDYNSNSIEDNNSNLISCTKANCFKRFVGMTAYEYHVQRCHDVPGKEDISTHDIVDDCNNLFKDTDKHNCIKIEPTNKEKEKNSNASDLHNQDNEALKNTNCKLNGVIAKEINIKINNFEFHSDSETQKNQNKLYNHNENKGDLKISEMENSDQTKNVKNLIKSENLSPQFQELSINLPKVSENVLDNSDILLPTTQSSTRETCSHNCEDKFTTLPIDSTVLINKPISSTLKSASQNVSEIISSTAVISHSSPSIRTVTAPTVSIPVELISTSNNFTNSTISCPTLIRPKPNQNPVTSLIHSSQNRKFKSSKSFSQSNGISESFQIPSSTPVIIKKRPLVPLKVSVNQNTNTNVNRIYPISSHLNVTSPNQSSRHIRSSSISPVTPILPATSATISCSSSITSTTSITGHSVNTSLNNIYHNGPLSVRRTSITTNLTSASGISTLVSLKPIQPKPKSSQFSLPVTTSHLGMNTSPYPASQSIIVPSISGISNIHISHQRQILPSPISKSDCGANIDESLIHKIESLKNSSLKRKRRKPEKKIRMNFHEPNRYKKFTLNPIQPKHITNEHFPSKINTNEEFSLSNEKYKTDEENSHSPGYSDLSETNDTPAPILEKEIDLKTGDCDKLVICTDFDRISSYRHNSSSSDNYDDPKDLSNKPPALMPAVLSSDLVNGSTNELDYRDVKPRVSRKKSLTNKKTHKIKDIGKEKINSDNSVASEWINISTSRSNTVSASNRKSFQSSSAVQQTLSTAPLLTSQSAVSSIPNQEYATADPNSKFISLNRNSVSSAINDFARTNKMNSDNNNKNILNNKPVDSAFQSNHTFNEDNGKIRNKSAASPPNNNGGKFSVQALTSPQELVSRSLSFATSSTVSSIIPNTKLSNTLFKN